MKNKEKLAVVGTGISGISAAHILQDKFDVHLFEKNKYVGGHTNTFCINGEIPVDTGFIVMNNKTYPFLTKFLDDLKIQRIKTDMSFSYYDKVTGFQYSTRGINSIFSNRNNIFSIKYYKFLFEILKFFKKAGTFLKSEPDYDISLGEFLKNNKFSLFFIDKYIFPMASAIWSAPESRIYDFPMYSFANFYNNHGLLSVTDQPQWYFIKNGSSSYVKEFLKRFKGSVSTDKGVKKISRKDNKAELIFYNNEVEIFDKVIIAVHADEAFKILEQSTKKEKNLLSKWEYSKNRVILHTDDSFLPSRESARASWNFIKEKTSTKDSPACITYDMTRLQKLNTEKNYLVTLNPQREIDKKDIIYETIYTHPVFNSESIKTQSMLPDINRENENIFYCGSYFGYGFHEDGIRSSVMLCEKFGEKL